MIWGSPGSGKSLFSCVLAAKLASENKRTLIFSLDQNVPMLPVFLAGKEFDVDTSVSSLFQAKKINGNLVAHAVHVLPQNPMIGVLGFTNDEIPSESLFPGMVHIQEILMTADTMTDYVIWDCTSDMNCCINSAMLEMADLAIRILTPDLKGINYWKQMEYRLASMKHVTLNQITLAGMARAYHAIDELSYLSGGLKGVLPFSKEMDRCASEGNCFHAINYCHTKYLAAVGEITEYLLSWKTEVKVV